MRNLDIYLFGPPRIELDHVPATFDRNKAVALLAYLALEEGAHSRDYLATLLWPDYDRERGYAYLRRTLWSLNDGLGGEWFEAGREQVSMRQHPGLRMDVKSFNALLAECSQHGHAPDLACNRCVHPLEQAVTLYRGDFMAGFSLRDSANFDEWQFFQGDKLKSELAIALRRLSLAYQAQGNHSQAIATSRRWLALDLFNEEAHRHLMQMYNQAGQRNSALRQYLECRRILEDELGVEPQAETNAIYQAIKTGIAAFMDVSSKGPAFLKVQSTFNLPSPATSFVGRETELAEIDELLKNPGCRLLTLLGPGGIGKTRTAIQAAAQAMPMFEDGVAFVSLAQVNSTDSLASAIASGLELQFRTEQSQRDIPETLGVQLMEYLRHRRMLLVLDNFEHLVSGADLLAQILANSKGVKLFVTSRERLRLGEEWVLEVHGMAYPHNGDMASLETYSAVQLFMQSAQRAQADFVFSDEDKPAIARICRAVQGVPLAIELAAAWVKMFSPGEIADEIEHNLDFLTASQRDLPERHRSLRAVFEHSWKLLSPDEQEAIKRLSIFRSPFRREAAEVVVSGIVNPSMKPEGSLGEQPDAATSSSAFLLTLSALLDKSLLRRVQAGAFQGRFWLHELIRQYAAERLNQAPGDLEQVANAHAFYYADWVKRMTLEMRGFQQMQALQQFEIEIEDVRAAWRWVIQRGYFGLVLKFLEGFYFFYSLRNRQQDADEDFRLALDTLEDRRSRMSAQGTSSSEIETVHTYLLAFYSSILFSLGRYELSYPLYIQALELTSKLAESDQARLSVLLNFGNSVLPNDEVTRRYQQSLEYFQHIRDRWSIAAAMLVYTNFAQYTIVDVSLTRRLCQESLVLFRELGDRMGMVSTLLTQASLFYALGEYDEVKRVCQQGLQLCCILDDRWRMASVLLYLGQACVALGEYDQAKDVYEESLRLVRELGNRRVIARYLACLGYVYYLTGALKKADELFQEALALSREINDTREMGMSNMNLGNIAIARGDQSAARRNYLAALELLEDTLFTRWEYSICLKRMGGLCSEAGEISQAWAYYRKALAISLQLKRPPEVLDNLLGMADLLKQEGDFDQAVEMLALILAQDESSRDMRTRAQNLLAKLKERLPESIYAPAFERGRAALLEQTVQRMLD